MIVSTLLAAVVGTLVGSIAHEASHAVAAELLGGRVVGVGWRGGLTGGPYIAWQAPDEAGWRPFAVGIAPAVVGILMAAVAVLVRPTSPENQIAIGGCVVGLVWLSQEDVNPRLAKETAANTE